MPADSQQRATRAYRKRNASRGLKRVEVQASARDAALLKRLAKALRDPKAAREVRRVVGEALKPTEATAGFISAWDALTRGPDVSGPEFDDAFNFPRDKSMPRDVEF